MIVQCTNCRARFRVADEKVTDRGVKVRCTKCTTVFRVTKGDGLGHVTGPTPVTGPTLVTRPNTGPHATAAAPRVVPNLPQAVSLTYGAASPHQTLDLDLELGASPSGGATWPPAAPPPRPSPPPPPVPRSPEHIDAALDAALRSSDPFANYGTRAPPPASLLGGGPPTGQRVPMPPAPGFSPGAALHDPFAELDFDAPAPSVPRPFHPGPPSAPTMPPSALDPFALDPTPPSMREPTRPPPSTALSPDVAALHDPFAELDLPSAPPPGAMPTPRPLRESTVPPVRREPTAPPQREPTVPPGASPDSVFVLSPNAAHEFEIKDPGDGETELDLDYRGGLGEPPRPKPAVELGRLQNRPGSSDRRADEPPAPAVAAQKPADAPAETLLPDPRAKMRARARRELASALFNVASAGLVAATALVGLAAVRAPRPLTLGDVGFPLVWFALGQAGADDALLQARNVRTGTFVTGTGHELLYVTGTAHNDQPAALPALRVHVEVLQGDRVIARADSLAHLAATPEDLDALGDGDNAELQRRLAKEAGSLQVPASSRAPFVAVFPLSARDVDGAQVRVHVEPGLPPAQPGTPPVANVPGSEQ